MPVDVDGAKVIHVGCAWLINRPCVGERPTRRVVDSECGVDRAGDARNQCRRLDPNAVQISDRGGLRVCAVCDYDACLRRAGARTLMDYVCSQTRETAESSGADVER